jgi:cobalt-zinc-cadmium efflux system outer membrane protein
VEGRSQCARVGRVAPTLALLVHLAACSAPYESAMRSELARRGHDLAEPSPHATPQGDGSVEAYVRAALRESPRIRAGFERWRAATLRISRARRLPEPTVMYGYFISSVQTRVGPQQHRVSVQQSFPWPTRLTAAADAAGLQARAQERRLDAEVLAVRRRVEEPYWRLWLVRRTREVKRESLEVLRSVAEVARGRLAVGAVALADVQQVELAMSRLDDAVRGLGEHERMQEAELAAAMGVAAGAPLPTTGDPPREALPDEPVEALRVAVQQHPMLESFALMAQASEADARAQQADFFPSFTVGFDWIVTGDAPMPVQGTGTDAVMVSVGVRVPLWVSIYANNVSASRADAAAHRAEGRGALDEALAQLHGTLARVRDGERRVRLYRDTLVPQAQTALESSLGAYAVGRATVTATLMAERDLLDLRVGLAVARAEHAAAWARLDELASRRVRRAPEAP